MLEVVYGQSKNREVTSRLAGALQQLGLHGTLYIGYPILATADESVTVDSLLVSREHSVVAFFFADAVPSTQDKPAWDRLRDTQDRLIYAVESNLSKHETLRRGRKLSIQVTAVTLFPAKPNPPTGFEEFLCADLNFLPTVLARIPQIAVDLLRPLEAALQRVTTIKPRKPRRGVTRTDSRGAILKQLEAKIANLDAWQKAAAIESPDGPQRIRGLAGSGKTVVLALKAAYLHAQNPDWKIAVTFFSRSLYDQFRDLIRRFTFEHQGNEPNWSNVRIRHAWGGAGREGLYTEIADYCGLPARDYLYGRSHYGRRDPFDGVCGELLSATSETPPVPLYDAVLIDEAQDLPSSFFQLIYRFTKPPRRIVWAYDELQRLSETSVPSVEDIFGKDHQGVPRVQLAKVTGQPRQDIVLPMCYRNPPWALTVAHGLGFGTQRPETLVQHFDDPGMWEEIGYRVVDGELQAGRKVTLERSPDSYPEYFKDFLNPDDVVVSKSFNDELEQSDWIAQSIVRDLGEGQLEHDDILIVLPSAYTARQDAAPLREALDRRRINCHVAGVDTTPDEIFRPGSIALAHIHRSKGNEAAVVYVTNAQRCVAGPELVTLRNTLFTGITRSRAWVRICGWGPEMAKLEEEIAAIRKNQFRLTFRVPTAEQLAKIRQIHRELTTDERARAQRARRDLASFLEALERGDVAIENLPLELRAALMKHLGAGSSIDEDT